MNQDLLGKITAWGALMFVSALLIALPVVITLVVCQYWRGFYHPSCAKFEYFLGGFTGFVDRWFCGAVAVHSQRDSTHCLVVGANL
jgi:flagellar biosynthesis protein FliR